MTDGGRAEATSHSRALRADVPRMSPKSSRPSLRALPWVVLLVALLTTAGASYWRHRALDQAREVAVSSAEGHFVDVVADHERRVRSGEREIEIVLLGATGERPLDATQVGPGLERLGSGGLAGIQGFVLVSALGEPTILESGGVGIARASLDPLVGLAMSASPSPEGPWASLITVGADELLVVGVGTPTDSTLLAVFDTGDFILGGSDGQRHHAVAQLFAPSDGGSQATSPPALDFDAPEEHSGGVVHEHARQARFATTTIVEIFGQPWTLSVQTTAGFLEVPPSSEIQIMAPLGVLFSLILFGLVRRLVRLRIAAERELSFNAARFDTGFDSSPIGVVELDEGGAMVKANGAIAELLGRPQGSLIGASLTGFVSDDSAPYLAHLGREVGNRQRPDVKYTLDDGQDLWVYQTSSPVNGPGGERHTLVQMVDVTEQHRVRDELQRRALHDELTALPNRALLDDRLDHALARAARTGLHTAALFIDLDRFKQVNDSLGHRLGDKMLVEVARRLHECARASDTVARFGGDEFVMLCEDLESPSEAVEVADRVRAAMSAPVELDRRRLPVTVSVGVAVATGDDDGEAMLRDADLAMYHAKDLGRDRVVLFDQEMRESLVERLQLEGELVQAVDGDQLRVLYQPLFDLQTDDIVGFEALVRWQHPARGQMAPDDFLPMADRLGLMKRIDAWVLETAVTQLASWSDEVVGAQDWQIAVNSSAANFADPAYPTKVREALGGANLDPARLTIELTEHALLSNDGVAKDVIGELRSTGVRVAIDDFGTGYSSFSQVASLAFDVLKIDRSLIQKLDDATGAEVVRTVVEMAHSLGLKTVAEGVESAEDLERLRSFGSDVAQGYFIARPLRPEEIPADVARRRKAPVRG